MSADDQHGLLEIRVATAPDGRSYLAEQRQRFPLRMTVPFYLDPGDPGMAFIYVQNPTGGVFAGDCLTENVVAESGARVHLTTQSATKLYRMNGGSARQAISCTVAAGSVVERMPDTIIPQASSRFTQQTRVDVAEGGVFIAGETVAPGRVGHGERFAYGRLELRTEVHDGDDPICFDTLLLEPGLGSPSRRGLLGASDYLVSLIAVAPGRDGEALAARIDRAVSQLSEFGGAAAVLPRGKGAIARILTRSAPDASRALRAAWQAAREELLGLPLPRLRK